MFIAFPFKPLLLYDCFTKICAKDLILIKTFSLKKVPFSSNLEEKRSGGNLRLALYRKNLQYGTALSKRKNRTGQKSSLQLWTKYHEMFQNSIGLISRHLVQKKHCIRVASRVAEPNLKIERCQNLEKTERSAQ